MWQHPESGSQSVAASTGPSVPIQEKGCLQSSGQQGMHSFMSQSKSHPHHALHPREHPENTLLNPQTMVELMGGTTHFGCGAWWEWHGSAVFQASAELTEGDEMDNRYNQCLL